MIIVNDITKEKAIEDKQRIHDLNVSSLQEKIEKLNKRLDLQKKRIEEGFKAIDYFKDQPNIVGKWDHNSKLNLYCRDISEFSPNNVNIGKENYYGSSIHISLHKNVNNFIIKFGYPRTLEFVQNCHFDFLNKNIFLKDDKFDNLQTNIEISTTKVGGYMAHPVKITNFIVPLEKLMNKTFTQAKINALGKQLKSLTSEIKDLVIEDEKLKKYFLMDLFEG